MAPSDQPHSPTDLSRIAAAAIQQQQQQPRLLKVSPTACDGGQRDD